MLAESSTNRHVNRNLWGHGKTFAMYVFGKVRQFVILSGREPCGQLDTQHCGLHAVVWVCTRVHTAYWQHVCAHSAVRRYQWDSSSWCNHCFLFGCRGRERFVSQHIDCTWLCFDCAMCYPSVHANVCECVWIWWLIIWQGLNICSANKWACDSCLTLWCSLFISTHWADRIYLSYDQVTHKDCFPVKACQY